MQALVLALAAQLLAAQQAGGDTQAPADGVDAAADAAAKQALPEGWSSGESDGQTYYYQASDPTTILWERPTAAGEAEQTPAQTEQAERAVLLAFGGALVDTDGMLASWRADTDRHHCDGWYGVECVIADTGARVVERLHLSHERLGGELSPRLPELTHLKRLLLRDNPIRGTIPESWGAFTRLEKLDLEGLSLSSNALPAALAAHVEAHRASGNHHAYKHEVDIDCEGEFSKCAPAPRCPSSPAAPSPAARPALALPCAASRCAFRRSAFAQLQTSH